MKRFDFLSKLSSLVFIAVVLCGFSPLAPAQKQGPNLDSASADRQAKLVVQLGHGALLISSAVSSPDGKNVLTGGFDNTARLWETETGREVRQFMGHTQMVQSVAFSPDGKYVLTGSADRTARLWEAETGKEVSRFVGHSRIIWSVAFSPDGKYVLTGSDDLTARLWEVKTGREVYQLRGHIGRIISVIFSPDGKYMLTLSADKLDYVPRSGAAALEYGRMLRDQNKPRLWEVETGKEAKGFVEHLGWVTSVAFSSDGRYALAGYGDKTARLYEVETGKEIRQLVGHSDSVLSVAFSADGKYVLTGGIDKTARLWETETGKEVRQFPLLSGNPLSVKLFADGNYMLVINSILVGLWDTKTGKEVRRFQGSSFPLGSVACSPDGRYMLISGVLWNVETGKAEKLLAVNKQVISPTALSADGKYMVSSGGDKIARLWERDAGKEVRQFIGHSDSIRSAEFSADNKYVLTISSDKTARLWDTETGKEIYKVAVAPVAGRSVAMSADAKYLVDLGLESYPKTARLMERDTGKEIRRFIGHSDIIESVAISPDGKYVLTGGNDMTARLWDAATGKEISRFVGHTDYVRYVTFSADNKYVLTTSDDATARLWDATTGKELQQFVGHSTWVTAAAFLTDGKHVVTCSYDCTSRVWDISTGKEVCRLMLRLDGNWLVADTDGRFDTSNLEEIRGLHWVTPDDPMRTYPLEIFMRDYYEPRLLTRLLSGEKLRPIRPLADLNRVQPSVKITGIELQKDKPGLATITVEVAKSQSARQRDKRGKLLETEVYDLRLFRDGQIVGQFPHETDSPESFASRFLMTDERKLVAWRRSNQIKGDSSGKRSIQFKNIKLPRGAAIRQVEFSAYAFNEDRVKSQTDRKKLEISADPAARKGRAYILSIGVNAYENPSYDLKYAVNDARAIQKALYSNLSKAGEYEEIIQVPLISDSIKTNGKRDLTENTATKANFKTALDLLAGREVSAAKKKRIPNADKLRPCQPEDLVLISFSCHGYADGDGNFFLVMYDTGLNRGVNGQLLNRSISSEELSLWLRDVDASEMMMIVDACHSAAAVEGTEFKPGPMGSRGLGQLSYDKGMRILTATQIEDAALGAETLKQGLLTYALVVDGLSLSKADFKPLDKTITASEWLQYAEYRVPRLYDEILKDGAASDIRDLLRKQVTEIRRQQPSLFDFSRKQRDALIVRQ